MMDGSVFAGQIEGYLINNTPPAWTMPPHQELGAYKIYVRSHYGHDHHWISTLIERRLPQNPTKPHVPFHIYIQFRNGRQVSAKNLQFIDHIHRPNPSKQIVYLSMPDGSVFCGELN